jgi:pimeloyl-ACP methyl ester carboxylesterase
VRGEFIDLSGARLYYYAAGTRGSGNPVVFIHGFPTSGHLWSEVVSLMPPGHRLVVLDLLGYGRSDRPMSRAVDAGSHADRVVALLDELRIERACIVGHGFGGGIAQCIAVRNSGRVSHLGLIDSIAFDRWPIARLRVSRALLPLAPLVPPAFLLSRLRRQVERGFGDRIRAARSIDIYIRPFTGPEGALALAAHIRGLSTNDRDVHAGLSSLDIPAAVVSGRRDRVLSLDTAKSLAGRIPDATLDVIADGHHFTPEETPRQVADSIAALLRR